MTTLSGARDDRGLSSILGFIVGMALLTASMATVVYFVGTASDAGSSETSQNLESNTLRIVNTLATSPGLPPDWNTHPIDSDQPRTVGLLKEGSTIGSLDKVGYLQNGSIDADRLVESYNLKSAGFKIDAKGTVVPVPVLQPPKSTVYGVGETMSQWQTISGEPTYVTGYLRPDSKDGMYLFENATETFDADVNRWAPDDDDTNSPDTTGTSDGYDEPPDDRVGNAHPDAPWFVETQLIPQMAGIQATFTALDESAGSVPFQEAAARAIKAYTDGDNDIPRWHVLTHEEPYKLPGSSGKAAGDHVLGVIYRRQTGSDNQGLGQWRSTDGVQSWALLGGWDVTGAATGTLSFSHTLWTDIDTADYSETYGPECHNDATASDCVRVRPSVAFWNTTSDQWTRIRTNASGCADPSGWNDTGNAQETHTWTDVTVDLCEPLAHTSGELWLALWWKTDCVARAPITYDESEVACNIDETHHIKRGWFVDDIAVKADQKEVFSTSFEPMQNSDRETLFLSTNVSYDADDDAPSGTEHNVVGYIKDFVEAGGNVVAYTPGEAGDWLGQIGLEAVDRTGTRASEVVDENNLLMRMPYDLPTDDAAYDADSVGWTLSTPSNPLGGGTPAGFTALDTVHRTTDQGVATLARGSPYEDGGHVTAVSYDLLGFNDTDLRDKLLRNLYVSSVFKDPTFDVVGAKPPASGTVPLSALERVILVDVTEDQKYQVPLEVSVYMWPTQVS